MFFLFPQHRSLQKLGNPSFCDIKILLPFGSCLLFGPNEKKKKKFARGKKRMCAISWTEIHSSFHPDTKRSPILAYLTIPLGLAVSQGHGSSILIPNAYGVPQIAGQVEGGIRFPTGLPGIIHLFQRQPALASLTELMHLSRTTKCNRAQDEQEFPWQFLL